MKWHDLLIDGYGRVPEYLDNVLQGLTQDELNWQPKYDCNSIGWLVWHLGRQQDAQVASLSNTEQLWIKDKWYEKFNRKPDSGDVGFGHSPEQVAAFKSPAPSILSGYVHAVVNNSKSYIRILTEEDLDRELNEPRFKPLPTVGVRLISILNDSVIHAGQAAYLRGLIQGKGWQKY